MTEHKCQPPRQDLWWHGSLWKCRACKQWWMVDCDKGLQPRGPWEPLNLWVRVPWALRYFWTLVTWAVVIAFLTWSVIYFITGTDWT